MATKTPISITSSDGETLEVPVEMARLLSPGQHTTYSIAVLAQALSLAEGTLLLGKAEPDAISAATALFGYELSTRASLAVCSCAIYGSFLTHPAIGDPRLRLCSQVEKVWSSGPPSIPGHTN